jgi:hypothetical protein
MNVALQSRLDSGWKNGVYYPAETLPKMGATFVHFWAVFEWVGLVRDWMNPADLVTSDILLYYDEGDPMCFVAPDLVVGLGQARTPPPRSLFLWEDDETVPEVLGEVLSESSVRNDLVTKLQLYEAWGVREYFIYDPEAAYLQPGLRGFRLIRGRLRELKLQRGRLWSRYLQCFLEWGPARIRMYHADGRPMLTAVQRAAAEKQRADDEKQRADDEKQRADDEKQRADDEKQRADDEKQRADEAIAEIARLRQQMGLNPPTDC